MSIPKTPSYATFKRGTLPESSANVAYLFTKEIEPTDVVVSSMYGYANNSLNNYIQDLYYAGFNGLLQGGAPLRDEEIVVTDKYVDGAVTRPLFYVAYSRYWHQDWPIFAMGDPYNGNDIIIRESDGRPYEGNYQIILYPHADFRTADGDPDPGTESEIPYKVVIHLESSRPLKMVYNKVLGDLTGLDLAREETINPFPYFSQAPLETVIASPEDEPIFTLIDRKDEYAVAVPAVPIQDNRKFQYFSWRIRSKLGSADDGSVDTTPAELTAVEDYSNPIIPSGKTIRIGVWNDAGMSPDGFGLTMAYLEASKYLNNKEHVFINPLQSDHSSNVKRSGKYWQITDPQFFDGDKSMFDIIIVILGNGTDFKFSSSLDRWSKQPGKGLIFAQNQYEGLADKANFATGWGIEWDTDNPVANIGFEIDTSSALTNGKLSAHRLTDSPVLPEMPNPYSPYEFWFEEVPVLVPDVSSKLIPMVSDEDGNVIQGVYDNRIAILDPFSIISVFGNAVIEAGEITNIDSVNGVPGFMTLDRNANFNSGLAEKTSTSEAGVKGLYNIIDYFIGQRNVYRGSIGNSDGAIPQTTSADGETPDYTDSEVSTGGTGWAEFSTPWIGTWITTAGSISDAEIQEDRKLVIRDGQLMRALVTGNINQILASYAYEKLGKDILTMGDVDAYIEVDNQEVELMTIGSTTYAYTNTYGGPPFLPGIGYPENWIMSSDFVSRRAQVSNTVIDTGLYEVKVRSKQVPYTEKIAKQESYVCTSQVPHTTTTSTPITHKATWHVDTIDNGEPFEYTWSAAWEINEPITGGAGPEEKKLTNSSVSGIKIKSKNLEGVRSTAYAWVWIPNANMLTKLGHTGTRVKYWQTALNSIGYNCGTVDGVYDAVMAAAVLRFQIDHDELLEDQIIGPETGGRIAQVCYNAGKGFYSYCYSKMMLEDVNGQYGRRTNPWHEVYRTNSLVDYIEISLTGDIDVSRFEIRGATNGPTTLSWNITRITGYTAGGTKILDVSPNKSVSPGSVAKVALSKTYSGIRKIYVHMEAPSAYMAEDTKAFYWGIDYVQAYGPGTPETITQKKTGIKTGKISLLPGEATEITLPDKNEAGITYNWMSASAIPTVHRTVSSIAANKFTVTDTRTGGSGGTGATDSCTIKKADGIKTFAPKLPNGALDTQVAILVSSSDSTTTVQFYSTADSSFIGRRSFVKDIRSGVVKVGVKTTGADATTKTKTTTTTEEKTCTRTVYEDVTKYKIVNEEYVELDGHLFISGEDPPPAYTVFKPYVVRQHSGRLNVRLLGPDSNLTRFEPWFPRVTYGRFTEKIVPQNVSHGWVASYNGAELEAFYEIPREVEGSYGIGTEDYIGERLTYVGTRQAVTGHSPLWFDENGYAFSCDINTTPVDDDDIADISKDGLITFAFNISVTDDIIADFTIKSELKELRFLNMNPYPSHVLTVDERDYETVQKIGLQVHVYLLPAYCRIDGRVIGSSIETDVLHCTTIPDMFDPTSDYYNPLAVHLGIISCTTPVGPEDVVLLDARSRGGGLSNASSTNLFDVDYFSDQMYPENGVVIIDIAKEDMDKIEEITTAIEKNIALGTIYKIRWV